MVPRYAYTVGLRESCGFELILAGGAVYELDEVNIIMKLLVSACFESGYSREVRSKAHGTFSIGESHPTWNKKMLLAAMAFYKMDTVPARQIIPDKIHTTVDVPLLSEKWDGVHQPIWKWLAGEWDLPIPSTSTAVTNLSALKGEPVTEASRWEDDEWELFAGPGPDVPQSEMRVVPIGTLLGADKSLARIIELPVGKALWRDPIEMQWHDWAAA